MSANLGRMKLSFKLYQNEHDSFKETGEKVRKPCNVDQKISRKILFHYHQLPFLSSYRKILKASLKTFPTKLQPTKYPANAKKDARKAKEEGRRESEM